MPRKSCKDQLLDAAEAVVRESGALCLTLDAVAAKAGVSKGGLLYHFPSKDALLRDMVTRQLERFDRDTAAAREQLPDEPSRELCAYIQAGAQDSAQNKQLCAALLAATANNPRLLKPVKKFHAANLKRLAGAEIGEDRAMILWLATDGLWLLEMLQISPLTASQRKRITRKLLELAQNWA